jgi:hypothetical protein
MCFSLAAFSALVCVYDVNLSPSTMDILQSAELNPVCSSVIETGGVPLLIQVKTVTTIIAVIVMITLVYTRCRRVLFVAAVTQFSLLAMLNTGMQTPGCDYKLPWQTVHPNELTPTDLVLRVYCQE